MKTISLNSSKPLAGRPQAGMLDRVARRLVLRKLSAIKHGMLVIRDGDKQHVFGQHDGDDSLDATITVRDPRLYGDIAYGGSIGSGEAWMQGYWDCDDLVKLVRLMLRNRHLLEGIDSGLGRLTRTFKRFAHTLNRNTRRGARRNIAAHYDLGNEFFALWLDESMMYSCAIFERGNFTLAGAQKARLDRVCQRLDLQPHDHLVEIGTGWGGLAIHAARHYGCRVTTTTISRQQYEFASEQVKAAGLEDRITLLPDDYRDLTGQYDKLVSIEMIEAIGDNQYPRYFRKCAELLRPGGKMLIQAITIENERFEEYRKNVDFIRRYVFPGSCLPSERIMIETIEQVSDMEVKSVDDIGLHYATTLNHWRGNFGEKLDQVRAIGYSEQFIRMWEFYLCYCEGGFLERSISDILLLAERPS